MLRYIKLFLELSGIDVTVFTAHSTRISSTSKANNVGILKRILKKQQVGEAAVRLGNIITSH